MTKPKSVQRLHVVGARLTPDEWRWLEAKMRQRRASMSVVVRELLLRGYVEPTAAPARRRGKAAGHRAGASLG